MKKVKLGLIGCGHAVRMLYGAHFRNLEKGEFYAVMDINESRARRAQQWFGAKKIYGFHLPGEIPLQQLSDVGSHYSL